MAFSECKIDTSLILDQKDGVSWIRLNNPKQKNALSKNMITELIGTLKKISKDATQRVVVLKGEGGIFCSGADLDWMRSGIDNSMQSNMDDASLFYRLYSALYNFPKPIIVWVEKFAFGGATGLVACADYALADEDVIFAYPEVKLGIIPATIAPFVIKKTGPAQTKALMLTGEVFTATKALESGLLNEVCKSTDTEQRVIALAELFKKNGPEAIATTKHLLNRIVDDGELNDELANLCCHTIASARISKEGQEGVNAFFEKRKPNWIQVVKSSKNK